MHHVYIDYTNDDRPFYVGMGLENRLSRRFGRNLRHTNTGKKYGLNRKIISSFSNREDAISLEIKLIVEHRTFVDDPNYNGIGCNYTTGGEGCAGSEETRKKMRESIRSQYANGREPWNKGKTGLTYNFSEETRQKAREQRIAFNKTKPMLGKKHTNKALAKMRKPHRCSNCHELGHQKRTCQKFPSAT